MPQLLEIGLPRSPPHKCLQRFFGERCQGPHLRHRNNRRRRRPSGIPVQSRACAVERHQFKGAVQGAREDLGGNPPSVATRRDAILEGRPVEGNLYTSEEK